MLRIMALAVLALAAAHAYAEAESPREQMERGVAPRDVLCREAYELVILNDGRAACVTPNTAQRMHDAGIISERLGPTEQPPAGQQEPEPQEPQAEPREEPEPARRAGAYIGGSPARIEGSPAAGVMHFYITDQDLNLSHGGIDRVSTEGLLEFEVNGVRVAGPATMVETGPDTGRFHVKLQIPGSAGEGDVITARYIDESDYAGNSRTVTESVRIASSYARVETAGGGTRIGHEFTVRLYEPDANLDSRDEDKIPLERLEFRTEGRIKTTLAHPAFDANSAYLVETGRDTDTFEVRIEIPRQIDGRTIHIGHWYEIRYVDETNPAGDAEKIVYRGTIGTTGQ